MKRKVVFPMFEHKRRSFQFLILISSFHPLELTVIICTYANFYLPLTSFTSPNKAPANKLWPSKRVTVTVDVHTCSPAASVVSKTYFSTSCVEADQPDLIRSSFLHCDLSGVKSSESNLHNSCTMMV